MRIEERSGFSSDSTKARKSGSDSTVPHFGSFFDFGFGFGIFW